jgi:hypothetical protein
MAIAIGLPDKRAASHSVARSFFCSLWYSAIEPNQIPVDGKSESNADCSTPPGPKPRIEYQPPSRALLATT